MGNRQNFESEELEYYTQVEDPSLGPCEIYSSNKFSNCFIIKVVRPLKEAAQVHLFASIENQQNIYLLGLFGYRLGKSCHCKLTEPIKESVVSFWEYLSFSLRDILLQRRTLGLRFQESQLWHIIKASTFGYSALQRNNASFDFIPSKLMVNRDGRVRLNWMHLESKNTHSLFFKKIQRGSLVHEVEEYLSPEELEAVQLKQFTAKINLEKTNIFSLGMTLLECATLLDPAAHFYANCRISYDRINEVMHSPHCALYSPTLLYLIGSMINPEWPGRPSFMQVATDFQQFMKRDYSIRVTKEALNSSRKTSIKAKLQHH